MAPINISKARHGHAPDNDDAVRSITHLVDSVAFNYRHAIRHHHETMRNIGNYEHGDTPSLAAAAWNAEHALHHMEHAYDHADRLIPHIDQHENLSDWVAPEILNKIKAAARQVADHMKRGMGLEDQFFAALDKAQRSDPPKLDAALKVMRQIDEALDGATAAADTLCEQVMDHAGMADEYRLLCAADPLHRHYDDDGTEEWWDEAVELLN